MFSLWSVFQIIRLGSTAAWPFVSGAWGWIRRASTKKAKNIYHYICCLFRATKQKFVQSSSSPYWTQSERKPKLWVSECVCYDVSCVCEWQWLAAVNSWLTDKWLCSVLDDDDADDCYHVCYILLYVAYVPSVKMNHLVLTIISFCSWAWCWTWNISSV